MGVFVLAGIAGFVHTVLRLFFDRFVHGKLAGIIGVDPVFANLAPLKGVLELNGTPNAKPEAERIQYNS